VVRNQDLVTDSSDTWVQKFMEERPDLKDKVVMAEYLVHWAGRADEDDTWERVVPEIFKDEFEDGQLEKVEPVVLKDLERLT